MTQPSFAVAKPAYRTGFTLLELLLAIGLSLALLAAISMSLVNYYRWRDAGERQIDSARTRLAWTTTLANDVLQIPSLGMLRDVRLDTTGAVDGNSLAVGTERFLNLGLDFSLETLALYGTPDFVAIGRLVPDNSVHLVSKSTAPLRHQITVWTTLESSKWRIPQITSAGTLAFHSVEAKQRPAFALPLFTNEGGSNTDSESDTILSSVVLQRAVIDLGKPIHWRKQSVYPEPLESFTFRYFNGYEWFDRWDSNESQSLPTEVMVTLIPRGATEPTTYRFRLTDHLGSIDKNRVEATQP